MFNRLALGSHTQRATVLGNCAVALWIFLIVCVNFASSASILFIIVTSLVIFEYSDMLESKPLSSVNIAFHIITQFEIPHEAK